MQLIPRDVVAIGGSAGSTTALAVLIAGLPAALPAAVLVVQHIPARGPSELAAILDACGSLRARTAQQGERVRHGGVYVAPPDHHLLLEGDRLRLNKGPKVNRARPAIDVLFRSAACSCGPRVIGVILSGALNDGTAGLRAVKECGGLALVQAPEEAGSAAMPQSAIDHVQVDHVLNVRALASLLVSITMKARDGLDVWNPSELEPSRKVRRLTGSASGFQ